MDYLRLIVYLSEKDSVKIPPEIVKLNNCANFR